MDLSLVIITRNEEAEIERCIRSVPFASETIVVDSGSMDRTVQIADGIGARVLEHQFVSYSAQKQWALEQARCEWVLALDADESLDPVLADAVKRILSTNPEHSAYRLPFRILYMGRLMRFGPWSNESHLRLFRREAAQYTDSGVHEGLAVKLGSVGSIREGMVVHHPFMDLDEQISKMRSYARMWAEREFADGQRSCPCRCVLRPAWRFFSSYFLRGGFLEGFPGLTASAVSSWYVFLKWALLLEMTRQGPAVTSEPGSTPEASHTGEGSPGI